MDNDGVVPYFCNVGGSGLVSVSGDAFIAGACSDRRPNRP